MWTSWYPFVLSTVGRAPSTLVGVYQIALDGARYPYPRGWSALVYVGAVHGKTRSFRLRLREHHGARGNAAIAEALASRVPLRVRWRPSGGRTHPLEFERRLLERFEQRFGALPAANTLHGVRY